MGPTADATRTAAIDAFKALTSLEGLESAAATVDATPGWIRRDTPILWPEMHSAFVPMHWSYPAMKAALDAATRLVGLDLAERRNLVLKNPSVKGDGFATLSTLLCAYQTILPGEAARSHRHAPHALRVILEAKGSFSIVNGEKTPMESGDIVLTPGWFWHGHGHDGTEQAYWVDGLDVPLVHLLEPMFFQPHPQEYEPVVRTVSKSPMRFAWADTVAALAGAAADSAGHFGPTLDLAAPDMPTLTLKVHRWARGWKGRPFRQTANVVYVVMDGHGCSTIGDRTVEWGFGDVIAAPGWCRVEHQASADSVVFAMSDEQLMRWTKYYRIEAVA
ncbi:MAG: cupin domain-containing protein [Acidimicrobiia bacterium]|nr:cupin domain-containing protein [Acidimicrobiia bacterium]